MKIIKIALSAPFVFALFVFAGNFKEAITFVPVDLTLLFLVYTVALSIFLNFKNRNQLNLRFVWVWLGLAIIITFSLLYSPSNLVALEKYLRFIFISTWCFIGPFLIFKNKRDLKYFLYGIVFIAIAMGVTSLSNINTEQIGFVDTFGSNYQALSRTTASVSLALMAVYFYSNLSVKIRLVFLTLSVFLIIPTLISGGRLAVITALIVIFIIFPLLFLKVDIKRKKVYIYKRFYTYIVMLIVSAISIFIAFRLNLLNTILYRINLIFEQSGGGSSVTGRTIRFDTAESMISQSPFFGKGLGSFGLHFAGIDYTDYPHHIFLELWSESGIIAVILFTLIFISSIIYGFSLWQGQIKDWVLSALLAMLLFWCVGTLVSSSITDGKMLYAFMGAIFSAYSIYKKQPESISLDYGNSKNLKHSGT